MICALRASVSDRPSARCSFSYPLALLLEHVGTSFQEQYAENILLELRRIHLAAKDVGCGEQVAFKFSSVSFDNVAPVIE